MRRITPIALGMALLGLALPRTADAFSVLYGGVANPQQALTDAARWAASSGLSDGIQVGVEAGVGEARA